MTLMSEAAPADTAAPGLVHWMAPGPLRLQPPGVAATAAAAFALGFAAGLALRWLAPDRGQPRLAAG